MKHSDEETINDQYEREIALIKANGNNKNALRFRYKQYRDHEKEIMDYIHLRTLEQVGRKKALTQMHRDITLGEIE